MKTLHLGLGLLLTLAGGAAVGCEDDRGVVDVGAGGDGAAQAGTGAVAGDNDGGTPPTTGGAGGAPGGAGAGGAPGGAAGQGGALGGAAGQGGALTEGGEGGVPQCPSDLFNAQGKSCAAFGEGYFCSDGSTDPCQFGQAIVCQNGKWERQEAFPAPCGGAGAGGAAGAGGTG